MRLLFPFLSLLLVRCDATPPPGEWPPSYAPDPAANVALDGPLIEVSGLALWDDGTLAMINDEDGIIFFVDREGKVQREVEFDDDGGDFEDIERVGDHLYVLRSDGDLWRVDGRTGKDDRFKLPDRFDKIDEFEAMFVRGGTLFVVGKDCKDDLTPVLSFDPDKEEWGEGRDELPADDKDCLNLSATAIHPQTGELYALSAINGRLYIFDADYQLAHAYKLGTFRFPQPEGIVFAPDGTMYITNEGGNGVATMLQYTYEK